MKKKKIYACLLIPQSARFLIGCTLFHLTTDKVMALKFSAFPTREVFGRIYRTSLILTSTEMTHCLLLPHGISLQIRKQRKRGSRRGCTPLLSVTHSHHSGADSLRGCSGRSFDRPSQWLSLHRTQPLLKLLPLSAPQSPSESPPS